MQCLGAISGAAVVKAFENAQFETVGGGANTVNAGYSKTAGLGAEIMGTFLLVYTVFSATDAKRNARDSHVPVSLMSFSVMIKIKFMSNNFVVCFVDVGSIADWVRGVPSAFGHHSDHRNWHQSGQKPRRRPRLQPPPSLA